METKILGCVVTAVSKDQIQVKEIQSGEKLTIITEFAKAYSPGDLLTIDHNTNTVSDCMEEYPFI